MSVWKSDDEFFNSDEELRLNHEEFDQWLDSINESGDPDRDEEYYNKEMEKQGLIVGKDYIMTVTNN